MPRDCRRGRQRSGGVRTGEPYAQCMDQSQDRQSQPRTGEPGARRTRAAARAATYCPGRSSPGTRTNQDRSSPIHGHHCAGGGADKVGSVAGGLTAAPRPGVEAGRYRLVAARACPWANRTISCGVCSAVGRDLARHPVPHPRRAVLDLRPGPGRRDPVLGTQRLQENYFSASGLPPRDHGAGHRGLPRRVGDQRLPRSPWTSPRSGPHTPGRARSCCRRSLWTRCTRSPPHLHRGPHGVYRAGSRLQEASESAYDRLWTRWTGSRSGTDASVPYGGHHPEPTCGCSPRSYGSTPSTTATQCNRNKLDQMSALWVRRTCSRPRLRGHDRLRQIKSHYYEVHGTHPTDRAEGRTCRMLRAPPRGARGSPFGGGTAPGRSVRTSASRPGTPDVPGRAMRSTRAAEPHGDTGRWRSG